MHNLYPPAAALRGRVGMVVPAWFPPAVPLDSAAALLFTTLDGCAVCAAPRDIAVVTDGCPTAHAAATAIAGRLAREWGEPFALLPLPENRGKGAALVAGIRHLLGGDSNQAAVRETRPAPAWIVTRDADGDHMAEDLPHLFRAGEQAAAACPDRPVCVIGRRANLHAPLGWVRGELELLLNDVLVEAVTYARARRGHAWDSRFLVDRVPDLQSGYKLYSTSAAVRAAAALEGAAAARPELDLLRTGMEIVPFVELALADAVFVEVERKSFHDQPVTSYGSVDLPLFYAGKLAWALARCEVAPAAAGVMLDAAIARRPLYCDPHGRELLLRLRREAAARTGGSWSRAVLARSFL